MSSKLLQLQKTSENSPKSKVSIALVSLVTRGRHQFNLEIQHHHKHNMDITVHLILYVKIVKVFQVCNLYLK